MVTGVQTCALPISGWSTSPIYRHRFSSTGDHSVRLAVRNSFYQQDEFFGKIKIHDESPSLQFLRQKGIISSEENPNALITRAELAEIIVKATKIVTPTPRFQQFTDVPQNSSDARYIAAVSARGWISPRTNFAWQPDGSVNRAEASKVVVSALYPRVAETNSISLSDVPESVWYARFAEVVAAENLLTIKNNRFNPAAPVTRAEIARMIATLLDKYSFERRYANLIEANGLEFHSAASAPNAREFLTKIFSQITQAD